MNANPVETVREAGHRVREVERVLAQAVQKRDEAVRAAVQVEKKSAVAAAAGLSRQRVDQIVAAA